MSGLIPKAKKSEFMKILQNRVYKGRKIFTDEISDLKIRHSERTTYLMKIKDAVEMGLPTVAVAFWDKFDKTTGNVIDKNLQQYEQNVVSLNNKALFLRKAFGSPEYVLDPVNPKIVELGELFFYLNSIYMPEHEIEQIINPRLINQTTTKFSDAIQLGLILSTSSVYGVDDQFQKFQANVMIDYVQNFVINIMNSQGSNGSQNYNFSNTFLQDAKERIDYLKEGIQKWSFIDRNNFQKDINYKSRIVMGVAQPKDENEVIDFTLDTYENKLKVLTALQLLDIYLTNSMGYVSNNQYQFDYNA